MDTIEVTKVVDGEKITRVIFDAPQSRAKYENAGWTVPGKKKGSSQSSSSSSSSTAPDPDPPADEKPTTGSKGPSSDK